MAKQHQLLAVPMLADVLSWRARMAAEPVAEALGRMLGRLAERLIALFERYVQDMVRPFCCCSLPKCKDAQAVMSTVDNPPEQHPIAYHACSAGIPMTVCVMGPHSSPSCFAPAPGSLAVVGSGFAWSML